MSNPTQINTALKGGEWIIKDSNAFETFIPEDFNEEQLMVMDMIYLLDLFLIFFRNHH